MAGTGKPRIFKTENEFRDKIIEYIEFCEMRERFVNIAGFCRYCDMHRGTYYDQKLHYPDMFKRIEDILEDEVLQSKETTTKIFYLKNKFGYKDRVETENTNVNTNKNYDLSNLSTEQIKELLEGES